MKIALFKRKIYNGILVAILLTTLVIPRLVKADTVDSLSGLNWDSIVSALQTDHSDSDLYGAFPASGERSPRRTYNVVATSYTSDPWQTDATPCLPADQKYDLCKWAEKGVVDTIAANFLSLGTKVRFPDLYGDKVFTVRDRMNSKYNGQNRIDFYIAVLDKDGKVDGHVSKDKAINFGVKRLKMEVF